MDSQRYERVSELFLAVREMVEKQRIAFLDSACGDDHALIGEVLSLLQHDDPPGDFIEQPAVGEGFHIPASLGDGAVQTTNTTENQYPSHIGHYKILGVLGQGGMGTVYEARQENPRRVVALKVIQPGMTASRLLKRFEHEAQLLGQLEHEGIARIHEAGTFDSPQGPLPYFAMELVRGNTLLQYTDTHNLDTAQRLKLVAEICDAVQHAHQKGIIHRDLKPTNILVNEQGRPKILDFGVARATDSDVQMTTMRTDVGQLLGTLPYMSPEQVKGDPIQVDTRSDVYALGVITYELLTGHLPLDVRRKTIAEAARIIADDDPSRLSRFSRVYRGDIETIVTKALEKDKDRRYQSASDLGADIRRYLVDEPIVAHPASAVYQLHKFARRNKVLVGGLAAVLVALVAGIIGTTWGMTQATAARNIAVENERQAKRELTKAQQLTTFIRSMLQAVEPEVALGRDTELFRSILDDAAGRVDKELAGQVEVEVLIRNTIGSAYTAIAAYEQADEQLVRAFELAQTELGERHRITLEIRDNLASLRLKQSRLEEAEALFSETIKWRRELFGYEHPDTLKSQLGYVRTANDQGRWLDAVNDGSDLLEMSRRILGDDDPGTISAAFQLGTAYKNLGRIADAEPLYREVLQRSRTLRGDRDPRTLNAMRGLASLYRRNGQYEKAEPLYLEVLEHRRELYEEDHPKIADAMNSLGMLYRSQDRYQEAEQLYVQVLEINRRVLGDEHQYSLITMINLATVYDLQGRNKEAVALLRERAEISDRAFGAENSDALMAWANLAMLYQKQEQYIVAESLFAKVIKNTRRVLPPDHAYLGFFLLQHGLCLTEMDQFAGAETDLLEAHDILVSILTEQHRESRRAVKALIDLYKAWNKPNEAAQWHVEFDKQADDSSP